MVARGVNGVLWFSASCCWLDSCSSSIACVGVGDGSILVRGGPRGDESVRLPDAEQMIDDLDRIMTANGTIGVKSPDVWGQDRLAKFRSEYETQMSEWLKTAFKGEVNASVRRGETEVRRLHVGAGLVEHAHGGGEDPGGGRRGADATASADSLARSLADADAGAFAAGAPRRRRRPCSSRPSCSTSTRTT